MRWTLHSPLVESRRGSFMKGERLPACSQGTGETELFGRDRVQIWVRDELACAREFDLAILGGCCGTDEHYIDALAKAVVG